MSPFAQTLIFTDSESDVRSGDGRKRKGVQEIDRMLSVQSISQLHSCNLKCDNGTIFHSGTCVSDGLSGGDVACTYLGPFDGTSSSFPRIPK